MSSLLDFFPHLPVSQWMTQLIDWLTIHLSFLFDSIKNFGTSLMEGTTQLLMYIPPLVFIVIVMFIAYWVTGKKFGLAIFAIAINVFAAYLMYKGKSKNEKMLKSKLGKYLKNIKIII